MTHLTNDTPSNESLLGSDFAEICARYGAPMRCEDEPGVLRLVYGGDDETPRGQVELMDGVVTAVAGKFGGAIRRGGEQNMVGWPVEAVLPQLGKPLRTVELSGSTRFEFAHCAVTAHEGTVACVVPMGDSPKASA